MNLNKLTEKFLVPHDKNSKFLYKCPHCGDEIYEGDVLFVMDGVCYCFECERPPLFEMSSFNVVYVENTPTPREFVSILHNNLTKECLK